MPFQDYGYKPSGITRPKARPAPKPSSSYYSGNEFGSGNIFTETSPGASTVNFGNNNNNDNDNRGSRAPSLMQPRTPTVTAPAAPTPAQIEADRQDRIARVFEATGATLPQDTGRGGSAGRGIDLYSRDIFKTPYVATPDNTQEIEDYLQRTAVDDALRDALGIPDVYIGKPTEEEPETNIDMSILQEALMPEPITVEELPDGTTPEMFEGRDGSYMFEDIDEEQPKGLMSSRFDTKGETPARELPEVLSIPEAASYMGRKRAGLIMEGINKLFGMFPPKTDVEKQAKTELEYFLDAQPESSLPDFFKYVPDKVQLAEYMKGRAERKKAAGTMNFTEGDVDTSNLQFVDIEDEQPKGLMSRRFDTKGGEVAGATTKAYDFLTKAGLNPPENQLLSEKLAVTGDQFTNREDALEFIDDSLDFEPTRKAAFSATVDAESSSGLLEGSNYNKQAAIATLGGGDANRIARIEALYGRSNRLSPEDQVTLFDIAYGGRMGNAPDEGHKYRGRGLIQITGKDNYRKYGKAIGMGDALVNDPDILLNNPAVMLAVTEAYLQDRLPERSDGLSANDLKDAIGHSGDVPRGVTWRGTGSAYKGNQRWADVIARLEEAGKQDEADEARLNNEFTAQQKVGAYIDGDIGPNSIRQMRSWLASKNVTIPAGTDAREIVRLVNATN